MKHLKKALVMLLAVCLVLSLGTAALAASGEGGASGGSSGSGGVDLSGMLALGPYVFVASQDVIRDGAVSTDCYGV